MAVLWAINHLRCYVVSRRSNLLADCSSLAWLFRSRNLDMKLHRLALSLQEYDINLRLRAGSAKLVPYCRSRLPHPAQQQCFVDDPFKDDTSLVAPRTFSQHSGMILDGIVLKAFTLFDEPTAKPQQPLEATAVEVTTAIACVLWELPFATCASLGDKQTPVRLSGRLRPPSVRLRDLDYPNTHSKKPWRGEADNLPRRRTPFPVGASQYEPQQNQLTSTSVTILPWENDMDSSAARPMSALPQPRLE